ncbi:MAG: D-alanine--D-alanine ligase [Candidatus Humimicrobiia bacterium]
MKKKIRVAILMGGTSAEREVSLSTGASVIEHFDRNKYEIIPVEINKEGRWIALPDPKKQLPLKEQKLVKNQKLDKDQNEISTEPFLAEEIDVKESERIKDKYINSEFKLSEKANPILILNDKDKKIIKDFKSAADVVFIALHGPQGEDGKFQALLNLLDIPYTGSGVMASALGMNKLLSKRLFTQVGILVPKYIDINLRDWQKNREKQISRIKDEIEFLAVIKPVGQGSSVGVTIVKEEKYLEEAIELAFEYDPIVLVEKYIKGTEVACGILGNENPIALPPIEIVPKREFFDYTAKYTPSECDEICPARISKEMTKKVQKYALKAHNVLGCIGFSRVDLFISGDDVYVSEVNTIPGLTFASLYPKEAKAAGISFTELLDRLITLALENPVKY